MKIFHTSPEKIESINAYGIAGDCLFFSGDVYQMSAAATLTYTLEIDEDSIISASQLHDEAIISEIAEYFDCDEEFAESLLDASVNEWNQDFECDADMSWWLQGKRGQCAKAMGYDACRDEDEQGTVYIVPMTGREADLVLENE
ncbi:hypothetical protein F7Q91_02825 [Vibrio chagasii]|uniref:Uncharacterized protein n=2 Tax=Vibrio chagasii TaxID=170679 RepID=A0A7V7THW8_9VIBR|nr:hypothetical protein [Vibrio chagasii]KAB0482354.1 hypothetical protein F7Q91_02825 [Vibrio chagasii]